MTSIRSLILVLAVALSIATPPASAAQTETTVGVRNGMRATLVKPDGPGPYPGVLILHTSGGLEESDLAFANRLANEGYICLVPSFMAAYGLSAQSRYDAFTRDGDAIYADLVAALDTLKSDPKVQTSKLAAIGFSAGGYFAVWLALTNKVQAAVGYYGAYSGAGTDKKLTRFEKLASAGIIRGTRGPARGGSSSGDSNANIDAWKRTLDFLRTYASIH